MPDTTEESVKKVADEVAPIVAVAVQELSAYQELKGYFLSCSAWCDKIHHVEAPVPAKSVVVQSTESK